MYSATIHADGPIFTIGISNPKNSGIIELEQVELTGKNISDFFIDLAGSQLISTKIKQANETKFYSTTSSFTLIPSPFFEKKNIELSVSSILETGGDNKIRYDFIPEIDSYLVYLSNELAEHKVKSKFGPVQFKHHFSSLISTYFSYYSTQKGNSAFVQYHHGKFTLCLFADKKMVHFNVFDFSSYEDIVYYTYYTMDQFQFQPNNVSIHIGGNYKNHQQVLSTFQKYSEKIYRLKPKKEIALTPEQESASINTIFDIQCG